MNKFELLKRSLPLALAAALTGCEKLDLREQDRDRADGIYRAAMTDYTAGRLAEAQQGFTRVIRANPGNSAARFQLACLLQDHSRDYLGALAQYREYLLQSPKSDKAALATERAELCERLLAPVLAKKFHLQDNAELLAENEKLSAAAEKREKEFADLKLKFEHATARSEALAIENERLRAVMTSAAAVKPDETAAKPVVVPDATILEEDDGSDPAVIAADARLLLEEDDGLDPGTVAADAKALLAEAESEDESAPYAETKRAPAASSASAKKSGPAEPPHEKRPPVYTVQEGDTLYQLAMRFYGRKSAWRLIQEANKATISTDGRIRAGQEIKLP